MGPHLFVHCALFSAFNNRKKCCRTASPVARPPTLAYLKATISISPKEEGSENTGV